jgi:hypothetical protein
MAACYNLGDIQVLTNLPHNSLDKLWSIVRAKFIWYSTREQIHHDQNLPIVHAVEIYPVSLARQKQFLLRSWVEIRIQLLPPPAGFDASSTGRADCLDGGIPSRPIVQGVQNMVHLGVTLMMNLGMSALDQSLLFLNGNHNPLTRVSIRGNSQQSVRISLHHLQISFAIQIPLGNLLP